MQRTYTRLQIAVRAAIVLGLYLIASTLDGGYDPAHAEPSAICTTDTDCARHCPPPADDPDCDGGPQS